MQLSWCSADPLVKSDRAPIYAKSRNPWGNPHAPPSRMHGTRDAGGTTMSDRGSLRWLVALTFVVVGAVVSACAVPPIDAELPTAPSTTSKGDTNNKEGTPEVALGGPTAAPDLEGQPHDEDEGEARTKQGGDAQPIQ